MPSVWGLFSHDRDKEIEFNLTSMILSMSRAEKSRASLFVGILWMFWQTWGLVSHDRDKKIEFWSIFS